MKLSLYLANAEPHAESHSSDVTSVPLLCYDITPVPSIINQSPGACISPRQLHVPLQGPVPEIHLEDVDDL